VISLQAGGFNGGDKSADFSDKLNRGKVIAESINTNFEDMSIGVACEKLHPALIEHDLCSKFDLDFSFSGVPLWQLGM
jgi:hypothetical protein